MASAPQREGNAAGPAWWKNPGVLAFFAALAMLLAGVAVFVEARRSSPVMAARVGNLAVRLEQARWMSDHMDHGSGFSRPSSMMPGMPETGTQRLSVELAFRNTGNLPVHYRGEEFSLAFEGGEIVDVYGADLPGAELGRGQALNTSIYFDVNTDDDPGRLRLLWQRDGRQVYMPLPSPPEHFHARPRGDVVWPRDVTVLLPLGNSERGAALFESTFGCVACHGRIERPGSNFVGPHLAAIGSTAASRDAEKSAPQYLYESVLRPNDYIVETCRDGRPCTSPSAMPDYGELLSLQDMADLISFMMLQTLPAPPEEAG